MADDFEVTSGNTRVRIKGLRKTIRSLEQAGADAQNMRDLMQSIGQIVVNASNPPVLSGELKSTIRAGRGKTKAVVRAGYARTPYAGVIHYGYPARNIEPQPFLVEALLQKRSEVFRALDAGIADIIRDNDLK